MPPVGLPPGHPLGTSGGGPVGLHPSDQAKITSGPVGTPASPLNYRGSRGGPTRGTPKERGKLDAITHFIASKSDLAARDIKSIPGGVVQTGKAGVHDLAKAVAPVDRALGTETGYERKAAATPYQLPAVGHAVVKSTVASIRHPLRDPFQTALNVAAVLSAGAGAAAKAGAAGGALRAGDAAGAAKALVVKPKLAVNTLRSGGGEVALVPHRTALAHGVQKAYTKTVNKAIEARPAGKVAAHGQRRIGGALDEEARIANRMRAAPATLLDRSAAKLSKRPGLAKGLGVSKSILKSPVALARRREEQAALELTSTQTSPEEAAAYHLAQAGKGVNPGRNRAVAKLYQRVAARDLVHVDESRPAGERVFVNPAHAALAKTDARLGRVQELGDKVLAEKGVRDEAALETSRNAPARYRAGAHYEEPTPGKTGVPSQALIRANAYADRLRALVDREELRQPGENLIPRYMGGAGDTGRVAGLRAAHAQALEEVQRLTDAAQRRVKPVGIVGGDQARPGRGFVSYRTSEKKMSKAEASGSRGSVTGAARSPLVGAKPNKGRAIEQGFTPKNITGGASRHARQIIKFVNTDALRRRALQFGSDTRRSDRDVLVREPDETPEELSARVQQALGRERSTVDTDEELATHAGLQAAQQAYLHGIIPGLKDKFAGDHSTQIGIEAPRGYRWVDRGALGDLTGAPFAPRGRLARFADTANSGVTAATVYFKVGHLGTRYFTNAATNIIQGSAGPRQIAKSLELWDKLSEEARARALAASGQHGFAALPHEGDNLVSRAAGKGAQWWARRADAVFRFNSLAHEMRKIGVTTPEQFRRALDALEHQGHGLAAHEWAKVSSAARRADREAISYDRLNDFERRYITRAFWFYPWVKGATTFGARTVFEHPYKSAALEASGVDARHRQGQELGALPSYEAGLFQLKGGSRPLVADFSTFSPFATPADVLELASRPKGFGEQLNPVYSGLKALATGENQYGQPSTHPLQDALAAVTSPTPEAQIVSGVLNRHSDQSRRMFPKSPAWYGAHDPILRALLGPGTPRRLNPQAAHKAYAREKAGR